MTAERIPFAMKTPVPRFLPLAFALAALSSVVRADPEIRTYTDQYSSDWYYYEREDGTCVITGIYIRSKRHYAPRVPDLNGRLREIAPRAFEGVTKFMGTVTIPNGVTNIGEYAFANSGVNCATFPTNLTHLGRGAFRNCFIANQRLTIPSSLETLEDYTFDGCLIQYLTLNEGLKHIGDWAIGFDGWTESVSIPNSVTNIGSGIFRGASSLTSIPLPSGLVNLGGEKTFSGCSSLREIALPVGMKRVGTEMFRGCTSLTNVVIPDTVESIGRDAFYYCTNLTSITLPANLASISANAFDSCPLTGEFTIPLNTAFMEAGALAQIWAWSDTGPVETLQTLRLPRQFEGRLDEIAPFGIRNGRPVAKPSGLQIVYYGPYNLRVESAYGAATPGGPVNHHEEGTAFSCSVSPSEIHEPGIRRRCTGWTGTGDVPATGTGTNVSFTTTLKNSSLVWNWESECLVSCSVSGAVVSVDVSQWVEEGGTLQVPFSPTSTSWRVILDGDTDGVVIDADACRIAIPADRPRTVKAVVEQGPFSTETTPVPVPHAWLDRFPERLAAHGGDYEAFGNAQADNGRPVWACYVAGLTPTNAVEDFRVFISMEGDRPRLSWSPTSGPDGEARVYTVWGKTNLTDTAWHSPTNDASRFFRVHVSLPE